MNGFMSLVFISRFNACLSPFISKLPSSLLVFFFLVSICHAVYAADVFVDSVGASAFVLLVRMPVVF